MRAIIFLTGILGLSSSEAWAGGPLPPVGSWKRGELWKVRVDLPRRESPQGKPDETNPRSPFVMYITVNGKETGGGLPVDCWRLLYNPEKASGLNLHYYVFVDQRTGSLQRIRRLTPKGTIDEKIDITNYLALIEGPLRAFPFELFPTDSASPGPPSPLLARVERRKEGDRVIVEALIAGNPTEVRVRQVWVSGELWWREYERSVNGVKVLSARREGATLAKKDDTKKKPAALPSRVKRDDPHYLRRDPKLQAPVTVRGENVSLTTVLDTLQTATGLTFTVDPGLKNHTPQLGALQANKIPSWGLMEFLASRELENGRWVKTTKGYRLTGKSLSTPAPAVVEVLNQPGPPEFGTLLTRWVIGVITVLATAVVVFSTLYRYRLSRNKVQS